MAKLKVRPVTVAAVAFAHADERRDMQTDNKPTPVVLYSGALILLLLASCTKTPQESTTMFDEDPQGHASQDTHHVPPDGFLKAREKMIAAQLVSRDIVNKGVITAMLKVARHQFVPESMQNLAYSDSPLPIGMGQTISQPYIVALMTQLADPQPEHKALDVGTGSGYEAAVLAELTKNVYSIEIVESLAEEASDRLQRLGYRNVTVRHGDGYHGWPSESPFDVIIVAAAPDHIPQELIDQLAPGGRMVLPVGEYSQELVVVSKDQNGQITHREIIPVAFVPMTGDAAE